MKNSIFILLATLTLASCNAPSTETASTEPATTESAAAPTPEQAPANPDVPAEIAVADGDRLVFTAKATGVQIYGCKKNDAGKIEWAFQGPEATLYDNAGAKIGTHYKNTDPAAAGPAWELPDGSKVVGKKLKEAPVAGAIPALLLEVTWNKGAGAFGKVTKIQRVNTTGGNKPEGGCDEKGLGQVEKVPYTATYYFYAPQ